MKLFEQLASHSKFHQIVVCVLLCAVFVTDFLTPLGFAHGILYVPVLIYVSLLPNLSQKFKLGILTFAITGTLAYYAIAPNLSNLPNIYILSNRILSVSVLLLTYVYFRELLTLKQKNREIVKLERYQRQSLQDFINAMPVQIWTADAHGKVDFCSRSLELFSGKSKESILADWLSLLHPDDRDRTVEVWSKSVRTGTPYHVDFRLQRHDGEYIWYKTQAITQLDEDGNVHRWLGSSIDIDDLCRLRVEAERLTERFRHTIESITDAFFTLDHEFRFTYLNQKAADILGDSVESLIGQIIWDKFSSDYHGSFASKCQQAAESKQKIHFEEFVKPVNKWLEIDIYPSADGLTIYVSDTTERKEIEQRLRESQKLEAVGHLTGGVAHDFNNLLTVILGNSELLVELITDPKLRSLAEMTLSASQRGAELTSRLLAFARRKPLNPKATDINQLVEAMRALLRRTLPENIDIEFMLQPDLGIVEIDAGELDTALLNLAVNARDAMPTGGKLTIETTNTVLDTFYAERHPDVHPGEYVTICVSDTGLGMSPETIKRAIEPFFTTKSIGKGSGLGLSMVFGFTKQSGGHLKIYSELDEGTSVKLYFPKLNQKLDNDYQPVIDKTPQGGTEHILIAEDDSLVLQHLEGQLRLLGYKVTSSRSGQEALEALQKDATIELLLTDVVMPGGMNGRELATTAQTLRPTLKVLYTSGYTENSVVHHGRLDPGVILLSKPYTRLELASKVRLVLDN